MVNLTKGPRMLVFMANAIAYELNRHNVPRQRLHTVKRFDGETDTEWCESMFTIAHCQ